LIATGNTRRASQHSYPRSRQSCGTLLKPAAMLLLPLAILSGCSVVTTEQPAADQLPSQLGYSNAENAGQSWQSELRWWQSFSDQQLNELVSTGLERNYSLQAAWANLARSRALWRDAGSAKYPDLNLTLNRDRQWAESQSSTGEASTTSNSWSAGLSSEYELDFWGRVAALDDQARMEALSGEAALRTQANTVAGEITLNWYGWRMQQENLQLLASQKDRIEAALKVTRGRFQRGQADISDVWQQEQLLESLNADVIAAQAALAGYQQQLALWTGQGEWLALQRGAFADAMNHDMPPLPQLEKTVSALPLAVVSGRPDVEQAWYDVQSATAGLAVAEANRYPRFTLSASYRGTDEDLSDVLDNWVANFVAGLALPLIDGGSRRALVASNQAAVDAAVALYQQTLLEAAQDVQQSLVSERETSDTLVSLERQLTLAQKTEAFQQNRYRKGVGDFLSLLTVQQDVLSLEQRVLTARWNQIQSRIALFRAVSHGGFIDVNDDADGAAAAADDATDSAGNAGAVQSVVAEKSDSASAVSAADTATPAEPAGGSNEAVKETEAVKKAETVKETPADQQTPRRFNQLNSTSIRISKKEVSV